MFIGDDCTQEMFNLIASVYRQALEDAERGDKKAIDFLDVTAPDWRELRDKNAGKKRTRVHTKPKRARPSRRRRVRQPG